MKKTILRKYAKLIARVGVKIRKGQDVVIQAELDQPEFVEMLTDECYKAGAARSPSSGRISLCRNITSVTVHSKLFRLSMIGRLQSLSITPIPCRAGYISFRKIPTASAA